MLVFVLQANNTSFQVESLTFWKSLLEISIIKVTIFVNQSPLSLSAPISKISFVPISAEILIPFTMLVILKEFASVFDLPFFCIMVVLLYLTFAFKFSIFPISFSPSEKLLSFLLWS